MKIIRYKKDGNTVEIVNKNLTQYNGNIYGYEEKDNNCSWITVYLYIFDGRELAYPLYTADKHNVKVEALDYYSKWDYNTIISTLEDITQKGGWTGNLEIDYAKFYGQKELAEKMIANRQNILDKREADRKAEQLARQEREAEQLARQEREAKQEEAEKQAKIENGITALKNGKSITAEQFELIAKWYNITLPIKFIGWLRKFCGEVWITKYNTTYTHTHKHKSTTIFKYGDMIAEAIGIEKE